MNNKDNDELDESLTSKLNTDNNVDEEILDITESKPKSIRSNRVIIPMLIFILTFACIHLYSYSDYVYIKAGPAPEVKITGKDLKYPVEGSYHFTTVLAVQAKNYEAIFKQYVTHDKLFHFLKEDSVGVTDTEMEESKSIAKLLALNITSDSVLGLGNGVIVNNVFENSPARTIGLKVGDVIIEVDDNAIHNTGELIKYLGSEQKDLKIKIIRSRGETTLNGSSGPDGKLGIGVVTSFREKLIDLDFSTKDVGGGSAGLLFTLAAVDALTPGSLSRGKVISGTGAIASDGRVEPIEGAKLKYSGAMKVKASVFFLPVDNATEQIKESNKLKIVVVGNVLEAIEYLCNQGSDDDICKKFKSADNKKID